MGFLHGLKNWMFGGDATEGLQTRGTNSDYIDGYLKNQLGGVNQRQAPTMQAAQLGPAAQLNTGNADQIRQQQLDQTGFLRGIMSGQQAGAGEMAVNRQIGQANAAQQAAARMARGANSALAARQAARNQADIGVNGAGQAAMAQMQDQQAAAGQLGQMLSGIRGQDLDVAGQNAQLTQQQMLQQGLFGQQANQANQDAALRQMMMNDQASQGYLASLMGLDQQQFQNEMAKRGLAAQDQGHLGSLLQAGGSILAGPIGGGIAGKLFNSKPAAGGQSVGQMPNGLIDPRLV